MDRDQTVVANMGLDLDGKRRFSVATGDALYLVSAGDLAVAYGESGAVIADVRTGEVIERLKLRMRGGVPDLLQDDESCSSFPGGGVNTPQGG